MESKNMKVAEVQLSYKSKVKASDRPKITESKDVYSILQKHWNFEIIEFIEEFKIVLLNRANRVLGIVDISVGGTSGTLVDPKVVFAAALKSAASGVILVHNHPSGNLNPSEADIHLTRKLTEGGKILDTQILDHIILTKDGYLSLAEDGFM
ncbi:MAG: JAB domain-containing protein [Daejeonella sp.]|uniref:JAB domain-containing protein n=2 Tax=unclassified Daejeonella TaxID=2805396 RepID=UPI0023EBACDF|nr:JAB domain-containing protein [Daejeonella sp. JGW-45]